MKGRPFSIQGDLTLFGVPVKSLGNLQSVEGSLNLSGLKIKTLSHLKSVGKNLNLIFSKIENLGDLEYIGGSLYATHCPIAENYTKKQIREKIKIKGEIFI